jgi:predicted nucleic acid-binding protein
MTLVIDSGLVVAALVDSGADGTWADQLLATDDLAAPHLMPVEVASVLRRAAMSGEISVDTAALAHADLLSLRVELFAYEPLATRVWELRDILTAYDGWYVALAESLGAQLATLDLRLSRASGPRCGFATPPPLA